MKRSNILLYFLGFAVLAVVFSIVRTSGKEDCAKNYTYTLPGTNISFEMAYIPGGEFDMGSQENESSRKSDEGPVHRVKVNSFWMGKHEVTWEEYDQYAFRKEVKADDKKIQAVTRPSPSYEPHDHGWGMGKRPAMGISLYAAQKYCEWLSAVSGVKYRLPTEAEWEYACRAGTKTAFSFGDSPDKMSEYAWFKENSDEKTQDIGQKKPNPFGLYDMHGNVWEYCTDFYERNYYSTFNNVKVADNPKGPEEGLDPVIRGGSWADPPSELRSANRKELPFEWNERDPQRPRSEWWMIDGQYVGFRLVRPENQ